MTTHYKYTELGDEYSGVNRGCMRQWFDKTLNRVVGTVSPGIGYSGENRTLNFLVKNLDYRALWENEKYGWYNDNHLSRLMFQL